MELERLVLGLITAILLPYSIPAIRMRLAVALAVSTGYAVYTLLPVALSIKPLVLLPLCLAASWALAHLVRGDEDMQGSPRIFLPDGVQKFTLVPTSLTALTVLSAAAVYGVPQMLEATGEIIMDDGMAIVISGFLISTFVGGEVVTHILRPFSAELKKVDEEQMAPLKGAGTVIGWLERSLTFIFVVAGRPEAVAVVVAIKALARFPELQSHQKRFAEYFLIGTMTSIGVALLTAVIVRIAIGVNALG
ncbi:hypothetical protein HNR23_003022 [Nocardiopsis mwathae]|uniref:Uncharacterized protein n=1 Tax=Nocardiopsis mwathae TaxID=1472723 RepID=A0A7W9YIV6_9ACTN|nr:hypothetical protein [Nocardiopsis mwathae]MBB6172962.1 hypothetical protein [Nocardiopsis mwathae]